MSETPEREAVRKAAMTAQAQFERESAAAQTARQRAFAKAQKDGLSLREIGEAVGLHHTRVSQIIRGK
jgi:DNA-directed RNA polymerase specialized sigma24 family protein